MSWGEGVEGFWLALSHPGVVLFVVLAGALLLVMWVMRAFAFPWSGIGEDLESFEDAVAFLRLWWAPIIFFAVCGILLLFYFWPASQPGAAGHSASTKPEPAGLAAAVSELTHAIEKASERLPDGEVRARLDRIEASLRQLLAREPVSLPPELVGAIRDLAPALNRVAGAAGGPQPGNAADKVVQAIGEAATKLAAASAPPDLTKPLATIASEMHDTNVGVSKPLETIANRLQATQTEVAKIAAAPVPPDLARPLAAIANELQETRAGVAKIAAAPAPPDLTKPLATIASEMHDTSVGVSKPLETIANRLQATQTEVAKIAVMPAPPDLTKPLATIASDLQETRKDMAKMAAMPVPPDLAKPLATIASDLQETRKDMARIAARPPPPDHAPPPDHPPPPYRPTLRRGNRGQPVKELQQKLEVDPDGIFGSATQNAVRRFQSEHGLVSDGIVGPLTWAAL